ncbi:hypothetical protein AOZ06_04480 [Kibdelosporangium phytohabitans]|uniref:Tetratricopeptide repeat protein n=1 Tax=Kibdelosporangium phytohabitans TaxID=860235 RepID=A0A0N9HP12_9PSEU|nr:hypothetical protein AOZ06_04480 [Kibdelosporangium phytohabitans]
MVAGVGALLVGAIVVDTTGPEVADSSVAVRATGADLTRSIEAAQATLRRSDTNAAAWADLGGAYVEQARVTGDPTYYTKAQGALERSLQLQPSQAGAMIGMGALANARHDFAAARDWGRKAEALQPDTAAVYGVLADALTQLGDTAAATVAVQRMLDLRPGVASFTRASYELETHGRTDEAREAMTRALTAAVTPDEVAFCHYYLGELAFNAGELGTAAEHYANPTASVALLQGQAKIAAARGQWDAAITGYRDIVARAPLPQYLHEYAQVLTAAGQTPQATQQLDVLNAQQQLFAAAGATDELSAALLAADFRTPAEALRHAETEWGRRQNIYVADAMAWALSLNGRHAEALTFSDRATALGTRNAAFAYHRGMILRQLGRPTEAISQLDQALAINPYFSPIDAPKARHTLAQLRGER